MEEVRGDGGGRRDWGRRDGWGVQGDGWGGAGTASGHRDGRGAGDGRGDGWGPADPASRPRRKRVSHGRNASWASPVGPELGAGTRPGGCVTGQRGPSRAATSCGRCSVAAAVGRHRLPSPLPPQHKARPLFPAGGSPPSLAVYYMLFLNLRSVPVSRRAFHLTRPLLSTVRGGVNSSSRTGRL